LAYVLCDEGDGILIPTPYYGNCCFQLISSSISSCNSLFFPSFPRHYHDYNLHRIIFLVGYFDQDLYLKVHARAIPVHIGSAREIFDEQAHIEQLESAYSKATKDDKINVRALLVTNPHNPLGQCYPRPVLEALLKFASSHKLHIIFDEIYALSVFDHVLESRTPSNSMRSSLSRVKQPFMSVLALDNLDELIDPAFTHVIYGLSKDFCLNGK